MAHGCAILHGCRRLPRGPGPRQPGAARSADAAASTSLLTGVSGAEVRQPGKSSHFSVNWVVGSSDLEVLDATTGKRSCGGSSRLCKHVLSARWARLYGKVSHTALCGSWAPSARGSNPDTGQGPKGCPRACSQGDTWHKNWFQAVFFSQLPADFSKPGPGRWLSMSGGKGLIRDTWCGQHRAP